ncbi:unnamed protein product [Urochloa humidicola]
MASPPSLLALGLRPCPPLCGRSRSRSHHLHLSKQSLRSLTSPSTCRRPVAAPVVERLVPRPPGAVACRCSYDAESGPPTPPPDMEKGLDEWPILRRWDVPWEWPTISLTMVACAVSFLLAGMVEQSILEQLGFQVGEATLDEKAEVLFLGQFSTTAVVLGSIFGITNTFRPFSDDIFRYKFEEPFKLQNGWLLWAGIGLLVAITAIALAGAAMTFLNGEMPHREVLYSICCSYHCCSVCLRSSYTRRISTAFCTWCCFRIFICSNSKSSYSYCNTCCMELWSNITANLSSAARL